MMSLLNASNVSKSIRRNPVEILDSLGIASMGKLEQLSSRQRGFGSVHMGMQDLPVGKLLELLNNEPHLKPPRTGHLGNWEEIEFGRAGAMDFNKAICAGGHGYPLIYCFTQTEAEVDGTKSGDWVYMPGSLLKRGKREVLPLFTWDGTSFIHRTRDKALFCPFVQTEVDGGLIPLIDFHWRRMQSISGFRFELEAVMLVRHIDKMREILTVLLEEASLSGNPRSAFQDLISHAARKDGTVTRCTIRREGKGYWLEDCYYSTTDSFVEHALITYEAVTNPQNFFNRMSELPSALPVVASNVLGRVFCGLFMAHYPDINDRGELIRLTQPFNIHLHWGARDMAGFPPRRKGYFVAQTRTQSLNKICNSIIKHFQDINPLCFVLLPASIFMLCPSSEYPRDGDLLAELFNKISEAVSDLDTPTLIQERIEKVTQSWMDIHAGSLSTYFLNRFQEKSGVLHPGELPTESKPIEPEGFRVLTLRQACMIVGALIESRQNQIL